MILFQETHDQHRNNYPNKLLRSTCWLRFFIFSASCRMAEAPAALCINCIMVDARWRIRFSESCSSDVAGEV